MKIGPIAWQSTDPVMGEDLTQFRELSGHPLYGLVGMYFLKNYAVKIDFDRGKICLLDSPARPVGKGVPIIFLDKKKSRPLVVGDIARWGPEVHFIDTGDMGFGNLRTELFQALTRKGCVRDLGEGKACTLLGIQKLYAGRLERFALDQGPPRAMSIGESPMGMSDLGIRFWRRYNVVFDFPRQTLYMQKSRWYEEDDIYGLSGLACLRKGEKTVVLEIEEGSPADQVGLKEGDILLQIGGKDAAKTRVMELKKILGIKGNKVSVVYRRCQAPKETVLRLDPWEQKLTPPGFLKEEPSRKVQGSLLHARGFAYGLKNDPERAIADFDEAIRIDRGNANAYCGTAQVWGGKKEDPKALAGVT